MTSLVSDSIERTTDKIIAGYDIEAGVKAEVERQLRCQIQEAARRMVAEAVKKIRRRIEIRVYETILAELGSTPPKDEFVSIAHNVLGLLEAGTTRGREDAMKVLAEVCRGKQQEKSNGVKITR